MRNYIPPLLAAGHSGPGPNTSVTTQGTHSLSEAQVSMQSVPAVSGKCLGSE